MGGHAENRHSEGAGPPCQFGLGAAGVDSHGGITEVGLGWGGDHGGGIGWGDHGGGLGWGVGRSRRWAQAGGEITEVGLGGRRVSRRWAHTPTAELGSRGGSSRGPRLGMALPDLQSWPLDPAGEPRLGTDHGFVNNFIREKLFGGFQVFGGELL